MPIMATYNNALDSPNSRKRKQELQYQMDNDQNLFDYYQQQQQQQQQQFYTSSSSSSNILDFQPQNSFLYSEPQSYNQEKRYYDVRSNSAFQRPTLHLDSLDQKSHHKELIQAWSMPGSTTENQGGTNTPGFFSPGFLESLQEGDAKSLDFPFHTSGEQHDFMLNQNIMVPEKSLLPESSVENSNSTFAHLISQSNPNSTSSSPMINVGNTSSTVPQIENILTTSSVSSTSSTSSPPPALTNFTQNPYMPPFNAIAEDTWFPDPPQRRPVKAAIEDSKLQPIIRNYLSNQYLEQERTVIILTSKVAQKSYGTEKRFLCPPPTAILVGTNWWTPSTSKDHNPQEVLDLGDGTSLHPPKLTVSISGDMSSQSGQIEWYTVSGNTVGLTGHVKSQSTSDTPPSHPSRFKSSAESKSNLDWYNNQSQELLTAGKCVSKHLFINDADEKRKRVEALVRIQLANGIQLGTLASKGIKVISKPSKKRQSVKNLELCIHHGTTVSLFNRIRSQTVSTKYLGVSSSQITFPGQPYQSSMTGDGTCFVARTTSWDPFIIWIVDTQQPPSDSEPPSHPHYPPPPAIAMKNKTGQLIPIHYNQHIVLQCLTTGLVSPVMMIRKVDKASTVLGGATKGDDEEVLGDPVSQLHKVALQIVQQQRTYLACLNDMVGMHKTTEPRHPVVVTSAEGGKVVRKRRVSTDQEYYMSRKSSISSNESGRSFTSSLGACWQEDVSDAAVWTIVGTESETYTFLSPEQEEDQPVSGFPSLTHFSTKNMMDQQILNLHGENFSRDLQVWFGEVKAYSTEYKSRELISCKLPPRYELTRMKNEYNQVPILFVKGDGTICKTGKFYPL